MDYTGKKIYIMSGTHWDREWYRPYQGFRYKLIKVLTQIVETLEQNENYGIFTLDGQTVILKDYLEICPEMRPRIEKLIKGGRLLIGPWYCMPDEFLVSGESLIANLMLGQQVCAEFGGQPWKYGYICDIFGHAAQTVQIFNGFGITAGLIGRGTNEATCPAHFIWKAPDGSACITSKTPDYMLYGDFLFSVILPLEECATEAEKDALVKKQIEAEFSRTETPYVLLMDALDHMPAHTELMGLVQRIERLFPGASVTVGDAAEMAAQLNAYRDELPVKTGQLIETAIKDTRAQRRITHTLSSRYDLKKENDICQTKIEKWLNPMMVYAKHFGKAIHQNFLKTAKEYLLKNQPHDSICGCSIDAVHADMHCRFNQIRAISYEVICDIKHCLSENSQKNEETDNILIKLWNPLPFKRREVVTVQLPFPRNYPHKFADEPYFFESKNAFRIKDCKGADIPYNLIEIQTNAILHKHEIDCYEGDTYTVAFEAEMAPMGETNYIVYFPQKEAVATRYLSGLSTGFNKAENEFIKLCINRDGTLCITNKENNHTSDGLLYYVDDGELGDGWNHVNPVDDRVVCSKGMPCAISIINDGPSQCVFGVRTSFVLPKCMGTKKGRATGFHRSSEEDVLEIFSRITLAKGARYVEVETDVRNNIKDHRLRAVFPTEIEGNTYFASQAFAMVNQTVGRDAATDDYNEFDPYERPTSGIAGKRGENGQGLALISAYGIHECACFTNNELALTLFRSFDKTIFTNGEKDGELLGNLHFRYAIVPLSDKVGDGMLQRIQDKMQAGVEVSFVNGFDGDAPESTSFVELTGDDNLCYSTLKACEDSDYIAIRVYNLGGKTAAGKIKTGFRIKSAYTSDLAEKPETEISHDDFAFHIQLGAYKIQTYLIEK